MPSFAGLCMAEIELLESMRGFGIPCFWGMSFLECDTAMGKHNLLQQAFPL